MHKHIKKQNENNVMLQMCIAKVK